MYKRRVSTVLRRMVAGRAAGCCEYCWSQAFYSTQGFSVEHIVPRDHGATTGDNLALSFQGCNNHKYNKLEAPDPVGKQLVPLYHPRQQKWFDHFAWNHDYTLVIGLTPTGRATVETLQLNREGLVNLRQILYAAGKHPPAVSPSETA